MFRARTTTGTIMLLHRRAGRILHAIDDITAERLLKASPKPARLFLFAGAASSVDASRMVGHAWIFQSSTG